MADAWSLTVDVPASDLVRRKGKIVKRTLGIPALHNMAGSALKTRMALPGIHKQLLEAALLQDDYQRWYGRVLSGRLQAGQSFDVLLIRRAPRPLDCAIQHGEWGRGGRMIYGDNLGSALKAARDWTAKRVFGLDGDNNQLLRWHVGQERSGKPRLYQIGILIVPAAKRWYELPDRWLRGEL